MTRFVEITPTLDNYWRSIILFGRNVASYKFALAKVLIEFGRANKTHARLEDLALPFALEVCTHLRLSDKQGTSAKSKFLDQCRRYNRQEITQDQLQESTTELGFVNVIDAFHNVNNSEIAVRFFTDNRKKAESIEITDNLGGLLALPQALSLPNEIEARWRLVETAWDLGIANNLVAVTYDEDSKLLFAHNPARRVSVTSCRDALNGYQKGKCFFCFAEITIVSGLDNSADVDHFFPHCLKTHRIAAPINGVWNLVLACKTCNRGTDGKFATVPKVNLVERLHRRNEYLISSHHPLRETLIKQTGQDELTRRGKIQRDFNEAKALLVTTWEPEPRGEELF